MPNLINNPGNVNNGLAQNYRRTHVGTSRFGTRTLQLYEIWIYGLTDAIVDGLYDNSREIIFDDTDDIDQPPVSELASGNVVEAVLRGVQVMGEIYIVGQPDFYNDGDDYNNLVITVGVSADTIQSGWEQYVKRYYQGDKQNYNPNAQYLEDTVGNSVDDWATNNSEVWDGVDIYPVYLYGDATGDAYGPFALPKADPAAVAYRAAKVAKRAEGKAGIANPRSFTPKMKRPG